MKSQNRRSSYTNLHLVFLVFIYALLLYLIFSYQRIIDFTAFYASAKLLLANKNPYPIEWSTFANLNPPFFLWIFTPLTRISYQQALIVWTMLSLFSGAIGATIAFRYAFSSETWHKYRLNLYAFYFSFFPTLMNISIVQLGSFLLFFIMAGYHFYLKNKNYCAGILWGIIIALKIFPGLLFFYVLKQGRHKVFFTMLLTFLFASLIPILFYGPAIYLQYHDMLTRILWFGDSWNASIYGFLFRFFIDTHSSSHNLVPIELSYLILAIILLIFYLRNLGPQTLNESTKQINHQPFCLTLVMMLLLSPFGWLYYFSLLIFPLTLTFTIIFTKKYSNFAFSIWIACFLLINFPQAYIINKEIQSFIERISLFSFCFYGLLLLAYLLIVNQRIQGNNGLSISEIYSDHQKYPFFMAMLTFFAFGLIVPFNGFLIRLSEPKGTQYEQLTHLMNSPLFQKSSN